MFCIVYKKVTFFFCLLQWSNFYHQSEEVYRYAKNCLQVRRNGTEWQTCSHSFNAHPLSMYEYVTYLTTAWPATIETRQNRKKPTLQTTSRKEEPNIVLYVLTKLKECYMCYGIVYLFRQVPRALNTTINFQNMVKRQWDNWIKTILTDKILIETHLCKHLCYCNSKIKFFMESNPENCWV